MYDFLIVVSVFVSLAYTIGFFHLVRNVNIIKQHLNPSEKELKENYNKSRYLGREVEALHFLQEYVWKALKNNSSKKNYDSLKLEFNNEFLRLGSQFPQYPY